MASDTGAQLHTKLLGCRVRLLTPAQIKAGVEFEPGLDQRGKWLFTKLIDFVERHQDQAGEIVQVYIAHGKPHYTVEFQNELMDVPAATIRMSELGFPEVLINDEDELVCPKCGTKGLDNFFYVEDVSSTRDLTSLDGDVLKIEGHYNVLDEGSRNERLGCRKCDQDCAIPEEIECDFE